MKRRKWTAKMKLGTKISAGFGLLIAMAMMLGGVAIYEMKIVANDSTQLAKEYIPQVDTASRIRGAANRLMLAMRSYGFTEDEVYYQEAQKEIKSLEAGIAGGDNLASAAVHLEDLQGRLNQIRKAKTDYEAAMEKSAQTVSSKSTLFQSMLKNADLYLKESAAFLASQNDAFKKELAQRKEKIGFITQLTASGTKARELNFKAQTMNQPMLNRAAINSLGGAKSLIEDLQSRTQDTQERIAIDLVRANIETYVEAMEAYLAEAEKEENADASVLDEAEYQIDDTASTFVTNCDEVFVIQLEGLHKEMTERHGKIILASAIVELSYDTQLKVGRFQITRDPRIITEASKNFQRIQNKFKQLREITRVKENLARIDAVEKAALGYQEAMENFLDEWTSLQSLGETQETLGARLIAVCSDLAKAGTQKTVDIAVSAMDTMNTASGIMAVGLIVVLAVCIVLAVAITLSVTRPIRRVITGLGDGADQVASASGQVSSSSQSLAEGASQQASGLEETTSSLEEMAAMTKQNADNANQADQLMGEAKGIVEKANRSMSRMTEAMEEISRSSSETSKIVKTIDEIAFQTNLLALNAAVEAARAGEAGAGFAVVADEVRNLAIRAAEAAKNTSGMIEDTVKKVQEGTELVTGTNEAFTEVAESAAKVAELVGEIAAASGEQSQGIDQVNEAVNEMNGITQQNAANAEESASASEELSAQAEQMKGFVAELVAMVGSKTKAGKQPKAEVKPVVSDEQNPEKTGNTKEKKEDKKAIAAEQAIPFDSDSDDFEDF